MKSIADFQAFIEAHLPDAPAVLIQHAIRESIVTFMQKTNVVRDNLRIELEDNVRDYVLDVPECHTVLDVYDVYMVNRGELPDPYKDWGLASKEDFVLDFIHDGMPAIILREYPKRNERNCASGKDLYLSYAWSISRDGCEVPDFIYERYMQYIEDGALYRLYSLPSQEWTNLAYALQLRQDLEQRYEHLKAKLRFGGERLTLRPNLTTYRSRLGMNRYCDFWRA